MMQVEPIDAYLPFLTDWARNFGLLVGRGQRTLDVTAARDRANADEQATLSELVAQLGRVRRLKHWLEQS